MERFRLWPIEPHDNQAGSNPESPAIYHPARFWNITIGDLGLYVQRIPGSFGIVDIRIGFFATAALKARRLHSRDLI